MTKVNKKFIGAMQKRLDKKEIEYGGDNNPRNYKNMGIDFLMLLIYNDVNELHPVKNKEEIKQLCVDIANRCSMLWERLESK